jgi:phenylpropionate dioxygenase-like ring-hydroxylating dioxygenase large terminal subunit
MMIRNQWYAILESREVPKERLIGVTRMGEKLVLWRDRQGQLVCMSDICPHRGAALSKGKLLGEGLECPFHGFQFDASGSCRLIPANGRNARPPKTMHVKTYAVREAHDFIYIWWGESQPSYPELPFFEAIPEDEYSYATLRDHWATHYSRAIENQLDVVHLPFVHHNTIGRGQRLLVNGPLFQVLPCDGGSNLLNLWVYNEVDEGQAPLRPSEIPPPTRQPFLQFRFPNLWHNWISESVRLVAAFAPIDEENTLLYIRMYQKVVRLPILKDVFNQLGVLANLMIERQDRRVVLTQLPKRSDLHIGEKLIQGDGPIIEYRRRRRALIEAAEQEFLL